MNSARTTRLLVILLALAAITCVLAAAGLSSARVAATAAITDLERVRHDLGLIPAPPIDQRTGEGRAPDMTAPIRAAVASAGAADALAAIEPGRISESGAAPIVLRFNPLTLKQLVVFVHTLTTDDSRFRVDSIECNAADPQAGEQRWSATVSLAVRGGS